MICPSPNIICMMNSEDRDWRGVWHAWGERRGGYRVLVGKSER